jgi:hypothetical protein
MNTIDYSQLPQWTIACGQMSTAKELRALLIQFTRGTYELYLIKNGRRLTIKYGMTADWNQGDRMYRQIWRFPGWPTDPSVNAAGRDLDPTVRLLLAQDPTLTKNDLYVHVWDMTELTPSNSLRPEHEPYMLEGQLIEEHYLRTGCVPPGNRREAARARRGVCLRQIRSVAPDLLINRLFEID